jgi:hypothetical protein
MGETINFSQVEGKILTLRKQSVLLDSDLLMPPYLAA